MIIVVLRIRYIFKLAHFQIFKLMDRMLHINVKLLLCRVKQLTPVK